MQSKSQSLIETITQTAIGFFVSLLTWYGILWSGVFEVTMTFLDNLILTSIFTIVSIVRGFAIRRFFNRKNK